MSLPSDEYKDDAPYKCTLDPETEQKAIKELYENPKERLAAVQQLREWLAQQPHLRSRTDTPHLLRFLRGAKFSQLRAREMLEGYYAIRTKYPQWFYNIDTRDPDLLYIIDQGYLLPLPGQDQEGKRVMIQRTAALKLDDKKVKLPCIIRAQLALTLLVYRQECTQVHGSAMFGDHTGATLKHTMRFPMEDMKTFMKSFTKNVPGRFKAFHVYNGGALMETMMNIIRPFMPAKFINRMRVHSNLESVYKDIPKEMLPIEYLPDDYKGRNAGTIQDIIERTKALITTDEFNKFMKYETSDRFWMDESKRPVTQVAGAFRKLNVD